METKLNDVLENYLCSLGLSQEEIKTDTTGLRRISKELIVQTFEHFYPIIIEEYKQEIKNLFYCIYNCLKSFWVIHS